MREYLDFEINQCLVEAKEILNINLNVKVANSFNNIFEMAKTDNEFYNDQEIFVLRENKTEQKSTTNSLISKSIEYIEINYNRDISLADVASYIAINPIYLSRLFKQEMGENFIDYLIKVRIEHSIKLLSTGKYKIYEISEMIGYTSSKYFNRVFRNYTGYTPVQYYRSVLNQESAGNETK
jgi:two-component system response regulator YesN